MDDVQWQERISNLERELVSTKLELACAKSTIDSLEHQLAMKTSALLRATCSESPCADGAVNDLRSLRSNIIEVPSSNPFSRKKSGDELSLQRPRKAPHTNKIINPGSCASALNLFTEIVAPLHPSTEFDSRCEDALTLRRHTNTIRSDRLNPNSCASGLNLLELLGLPLRTSSMTSLSSSMSRKASNDIALLVDYRGRLSASSFSGRRRVGSRNNARLGDNCRTQGSANKNADWGELK
ncbi:hypothetical protein ACHAW5_002768 [Stephanodiscus triporus]|uniref:Uncharacterized protein n=1 Tax=Stephanodiscus triporus TaxID=2934178 RepID=A0ABD3NJI5_9STRA